MSEMLPQDFERLLKRNGESRPELLAWIKLVTGADVLTWKEMDHLFQIIREDRPLDYPPLLWVIMFGNPANEEEKEKWSDCVKDAYTVAADKKSRQLCLLFATVAASRLFLKERDSKVLKGLREWFERICSQQPQSEQKESAFFLGMLAFIQGDFIQAARHMEIAATIEPAARFWSALCSLFAKNYSEAEKKFVSLKKDIPASSLDPKILEKLINLCRKRR
jgi:hypothetical protein